MGAERLGSRKPSAQEAEREEQASPRQAAECALACGFEERV